MKNQFYKKFFAILLVLFLGYLIYYPRLDFQPGIAQGDHGRDLYAAQRVLAGERPYRDFWWPYGPLMPYYYAVFFKIFGISLHSIMIGKMLLDLLAGAFAFLTLGLFTSPAVALAGALWFYLFNPEITHTYNHAGAVTLLLPMIYFLFRYLKDPLRRHAYAGLLIIFLISLIKPNIGIANLLAFVLSVWLKDRTVQQPAAPEKKIFYAAALVLLPLLAVMIYARSVQGLPLDYVRQCFPYSPQDTPYSFLFPLQTIKSYFSILAGEVRERKELLFFAPLMALSIIHAGRLYFSPSQSPAQRAETFLPIFVCLLFSLLNLHEFLLAGVLYQLSWSKPFDILTAFLLLALLLKKLSRVFRALILAGIILIVFSAQMKINHVISLLKTHAGNCYFPFPQGRFYSQNPEDWFITVKDTQEFLENNLRAGEPFLALPYDPLYYFLLNRKSPVRELVFFDYMLISPQQEQDIISRLEAQRVNYVLLSNRMKTTERNLGTFGQTHCRQLYDYLREHFEPAASFGDWSREPGCMWNHAAAILRRKGISAPEGNPP